MINEPYMDAKEWLAEGKVPVFVMGGDGELKGCAWIPRGNDHLSLHHARSEQRVAFLADLCGQLRERHGASV